MRSRSSIAFYVSLTLALYSWLLLIGTAVSEEVRTWDFGTTSDGESVQAFSISNANGMTIRLMSRGATLIGVDVPDRNGELADVVFGFDDVAGYESDRNSYFGCTIGRCANRIADGKFTLNGKEYQLATNRPPNHLHGGTSRSFDKVVWQAKVLEDPSGQGVEFYYESPDGEENYPGTVAAKVTYRLTADNETKIDYEGDDRQGDSHQFDQPQLFQSGRRWSRHD